jgi:hypothetical protein
MNIENHETLPHELHNHEHTRHHNRPQANYEVAAAKQGKLRGSYLLMQAYRFIVEHTFSLMQFPA